MSPFILPHQYHLIEEQSAYLFQTTLSMTDTTMLTTIRGQVVNQILAAFPFLAPLQRQLLTELPRYTHTKQDLSAYLSQLRGYVIPFPAPTEPQLRALFPTRKKLPVPVWNHLDLTNYTYYGWNDIATQQKLILRRQDHQLIGLAGDLTVKTTQGLCAICHHIAPVSLFTVTIQQNPDGTYIKRGDYICRDSGRCNQQLTDLNHYHRFFQELQPVQ